jgi:small subunit ribosomal protein S6
MRYEGLMILHNPTKEDGIKEVIDRVSQEIAASGGQVETVQKMDRKPFARVSNKKVTSGYYLNVIFESQADQVVLLTNRLRASEDVYRVVCTKANSKPAASGATP